MATSYIDQKVGGSISGIATVLLGVVVQRPADAEPTTDQLEEQAKEKTEV